MMNLPSAKALADQLATERFAIGDARSDAYKLGFKDLIVCRAAGTTLPRVYAAGSLQFDAYHAGCDDARHVWAMRLERELVAA